LAECVNEWPLQQGQSHGALCAFAWLQFSNRGIDNARVSDQHYENFPVASWLCPPQFRAAIKAIYNFARTADDIADEGDASVEVRLALLATYRDDLFRALQGGEPSKQWPHVFASLRSAHERHDLPLPCLTRLLDAFRQDVLNPSYPSREQLLDYCALSANPVGHLLLHLYGIDDENSLAQSDAICSALQLINFWQDLSVDVPRHRIYVPEADLVAYGLDRVNLGAAASAVASQRLVADLCCWAEQLMRVGAPLALRIPGRAGWELRFVVQGGLRILSKLRALQYRSILERPKLGPADLPLIAVRAVMMSKTPFAAAR
jgi:hydroxysqualene synthase